MNGLKSLKAIQTCFSYINMDLWTEIYINALIFINIPPVLEKLSSIAINRHTCLVVFKSQIIY